MITLYKVYIRVLHDGRFDMISLLVNVKIYIRIRRIRKNLSGKNI